MMITSFIVFLILFVLIGILSTKYHDKTTKDYLLASQNVKPWLVSLSFFATENSGFMFIGFIGMIVLQGLSAAWVVIGWYLGEIIVLWWTARKIRAHSSEINAQTYSTLLANWTGKEMLAVKKISALLIMIFLGIYGSAQLSAVGKALHVLMDWEYSLGAVIGFFIVVIYCAAGGIRASIWTDAAQSIVMLGALFVLALAGLNHVGGLNSLDTQLHSIDPSLTTLFSDQLKYGFFPFFLGWLFGGLGVLGQAHVMVRFMVIDQAKHVRRTLVYYASLVTILSILCVTVGLLCRAILPELINSDPELGLPMLAAELLPDILTGLVLAGLFAASVSTADSQILSSSAALSIDLFPKIGKSYKGTKIATVLIAVLALMIAISGYNNVFKLVTFAWSVMAAGFGPLLFLLIIGKKPSQTQALIIMIIGIAATLAWKFSGMDEHIYSVLPGILAGLIAYPLLAIKK